MTTAQQKLSAHCGVIKILDSVKVGDLVTGDPYPSNSYGITNSDMLVGEVIHTSHGGRQFAVRIIEHTDRKQIGAEFPQLNAHCFSYCKHMDKFDYGDDCSPNKLLDIF